MEKEKISERYPIIKNPGQVVSRPNEEKVERGSSGRLSPDAVDMISGGGPAAIRTKVKSTLENRSLPNQSPAPTPATPNLKKV